MPEPTTKESAATLSVSALQAQLNAANQELARLRAKPSSNDPNVRRRQEAGLTLEMAIACEEQQRIWDASPDHPDNRKKTAAVEQAKKEALFADAKASVAEAAALAKA